MSLERNEGVTAQGAVTSAAVAPVLHRAAAFLWDYVFIALYLGFLRILSLALPQMMLWFQRPSTAHLLSFIFVTLPIGLYFAITEASPARATFGKRLMHVQVDDPKGARLTIARSMLRTAAKFTPWELSHAAVWRFRFAADGAPHDHVAVALLVTAWVLVSVNVICVGVDKRRRTLYDLIAGSIVTREHAEL